MQALEDIRKQMRDDELSAFEREEMENMQAMNGHATSPYNPDKNEIDIVLEHTEDVIQECQDGNADLNTDAELISREIISRSNRTMMAHNRMISDNGFKYRKVKQLPPAAVARLVTSNPSILIRKIRIPTVHMEADEQYIPAVRGESKRIKELYFRSLCMSQGYRSGQGRADNGYKPCASE